MTEDPLKALLAAFDWTAPQAITGGLSSRDGIARRPIARRATWIGLDPSTTPDLTAIAVRSAIGSITHTWTACNANVGDVVKPCDWEALAADLTTWREELDARTWRALHLGVPPPPVDETLTVDSMLQTRRDSVDAICATLGIPTVRRRGVADDFDRMFGWPAIGTLGGVQVYRVESWLNGWRHVDLGLPPKIPPRGRQSGQRRASRRAWKRAHARTWGWKRRWVAEEPDHAFRVDGAIIVTRDQFEDIARKVGSWTP